MDRKQFLSLASVVFLAILLPSVLRQVNKVTRALAGAEGRLTAINIETDRFAGRVDGPFVDNLDGLAVTPVMTYEKDSEIQAFINQTIADKKKWDYLLFDGQDVQPDEIRSLGIRLDQFFSYRSIFGESRKIIKVSALSDSYTAALGSELINAGMYAQIDNKEGVVKLFDKLGSQRLQVTGNGSWIFATAAKDRNTYQVIVANYDPKGVHSEVVPVNFLNLEAGKFELRKTFWGADTTVENIATDAGSLQKRIPMQANTVVFLELEAK